MANALTPFTPQIWSREGVALLREKIVMPRLVRVDFSSDLASAGDVVNTRKPAKMSAGTVDPVTGVSIQNAEATNIQVVLTEHKDASFRISDREAGRSFKNLVDEFLDPAMLALANDVDIALLGLYSDFTIAPQTIATAADWRYAPGRARTRLNKNLVPDDGNRRLVLSDDDEGQLSNLDLMTKADERGDIVGRLTGQVGRFKGFDVFRASNVIGTGSPVTRHNLAFHRDAIALVVRNIATATGQTPGAAQSRAEDPDAGLSIRTTISYNPTLLSTQVTCDILYGVKTLDVALGQQLNSQTEAQSIQPG